MRPAVVFLLAWGYLVGGFAFAVLTHPWGYKTARVSWIDPTSRSSIAVGTTLAILAKTVLWPLYAFTLHRHKRRSEP
jgi:hypothetical protein